MRWGASIGLGVFFAAWMAGGVAFGGEVAGEGRAMAVGRLLEARCLACHRAGKEKGSYRVDTFERLLAPGRSGKAPVVAGRPEESELYLRLVHADEEERMPLDEAPLSEGEVFLIREWIAAGAVLDGGVVPGTALASTRGAEVLAVAPESYPHPPPVTALAASPAGDRFAVGGRGEVLICSMEEGAVLRRVGGMHARVRAMAWHPAGGMIAVAAGVPGRAGAVFVVDVEQGVVARRLGMAADEMLTVAFDPAGGRLACGGADNLIHIYQWESGELERRIAQHADWVMSVRFSPDGRHLASASRDRSARVYSVETGEMETTYNEHGGMVLAVAFNGDGTEVWSGGRDRRVHVWNAMEGKRLKELGGFGGEIQAIEGAGEEMWVGASDGSIRICSAKGRSITGTREGRLEWVYSVARGVDSGRMLAGGPLGEVLHWRGGGGVEPARWRPFARLGSAVEAQP